MRRTVCAFCLGILVTCAAWPAVAGNKEEAKQLFESGLKLMRLDDFVGASATFERSIALFPTQNSLFNLANCYRAMHRHLEALAIIERLTRDFGDKLKPEIKESVDRQQQEIKLLLATLTFETDPADATVKLDGRPTGTGPKLGPVMLEPGEHEVEVARPDRRSQRRTLKLDPGAARSERFVLEHETGEFILRANLDGAAVFVDGQWIGNTPLAKPVTLAVGKHVIGMRAANHEDIARALDVQAGERQFLDIMLSAKLAPVLAPQPPLPLKVPELSLAPPEANPRPSHVLRVVTWVSLAGAVAAGAVAGTFLVIQNGQNSDFRKYNDLYAEYGRPEDDAKRRSVRDDMNRSETVVILCGIGAGAFAVTALVTYLMDSGSKPAEGKPTVALSPAGIGVRF